MSQTTTLRSLSPEARSLPSGLKATLMTVADPLRGSPCAWPCATSQRMICPSSSPLAKRLLSLLKATLQTSPLWPVSVRLIGGVARRSHSLIVLSKPDEARN